MTKNAKSTKTLFRTLYKGKALTQSQVGKMIWKVNHPGSKAPDHIYSYWHGALENHVEAGRIVKTRTKTRGTTYRISSSGRDYAEICGIVR